jgi:5'-3' exonuclease
MGIRGLNPLIQRYKRSYSFKTTPGGTIAIDASCLMFKARGAGLSILSMFASLIVRIRQADSYPVVVFDGGTPTVKSKEVEKRRVARQKIKAEIEVVESALASEHLQESDRIRLEHQSSALQRKAPSITRDDRDLLKQLLHASGVRFVTAREEADDLLAWGYRAGLFTAVLSSDLDMLPRGIGLLLVPETADASVISSLRLGDVIAGLKEPTYDSFVSRCVRMGTDFTGTVAEQTGRLKGDGVTLDSLLSEGQLTKWNTPVGAVEPERLAEFKQQNGWPVGWMGLLAKQLVV